MSAAPADWGLVGEGLPLVLVHGALADRRIWQPVAEALAGRFRVFSYTQRYFGPSASSPTPDLPFGYDTHAADLLCFLSDVVGEPAHVAGWSYGADVAVLAALAEPRRFASLALYEPGRHHHLTDPADLQGYGADAQAVFGPVLEALAAGDPAAALAERLIDGTAGRPGYFTGQPPELRRIELENAHTLAWQLRQPPSREADAAALAGLALPVTVARGERTRALFALAADAAARAVPGARHVVIAGAGHMWPLEQPGAFARWAGQAARPC